jgi:LmbE family N-acetylglucosaminyl deacetylase
LAVGLIALALGAFFYFFPRPGRVSPAGEIGLQAGKRVLVLAPHSDDETLGAGGLIIQARRLGDEVRVVLATNGDGFRYAVEDQYRRLRLTPAQYIQFGYVRQKESLSALALMGVAKDEVIFLGYPDRGLSHLWLDQWSSDAPYVSPYTKASHSPYVNSFTPGAPYSGESFLADLEEVMTAYQPDIIVMPHPSDAHPDHWALNAFATYALNDLRQNGQTFAANPLVYLYLVHRGDWPAPKGLHLKGILAPPTTLDDTTTLWHSMPDPADVTDLKYKAVLAYRSQLTIMRRFLTSFARANEIFGALGEIPAHHVEDGRITVSGDPRQWAGLPPQLLDATGDTVARRLEGSGDIKTLSVAYDSTHLFLLLQLRRPVSADLTYTIRLIPLTQTVGPVRRQVTLKVHPPSRVELVNSSNQGLPGQGDVIVKAVRNSVEVSLPLWAIGSPPRIYVNAQTGLANLGIDRSAWQVMGLGGSGGFRSGSRPDQGTGIE